METSPIFWTTVSCASGPEERSDGEKTLFTRRTHQLTSSRIRYLQSLEHIIPYTVTFVLGCLLQTEQDAAHGG